MHDFFYVDKISHVNAEVVTDVKNMVKRYFGELVVTRGNEYTFLGMKIKVRDDKYMILVWMISS